MREARFRIGLQPLLQLRSRTLGTAQLHPGSDPIDGQRRFPPQPRRQRQTANICLLPGFRTGFGLGFEKILPVHILKGKCPRAGRCGS